MLSFALAFLLAFSGNLSAKNHFGCMKAKPAEKTIWQHERITTFRFKPYKEFRGVVLDAAGRGVIEALMEVFTHPEHLFIKDYPESKKAEAKQRRVAACKAGINGEFCFPNLPAGKYELRISREGFKVACISLVIAPQSRKSSGRPIKVTLEVGQ
jgi:hypothetical protein